MVADARLKQDIRPLQKLENGIQLYAFRYKGCSALFVGAMAQDLLADAHFRKAVSIGSDGYYRVDYAKLGLPVMNAEAVLEAGNRAAKL